MSDTNSAPGEVGNVCVECGMDLTPTQAQIDAVIRWGNPLRRQPCLETESGLHRVLHSDDVPGETKPR